MATLYIGCDHSISLTGLSANGSYLNAATVSYTLYSADGTAVSGGTDTLGYVIGSNGNYAGTIESTITSDLTCGEEYYADVTISQSNINDQRRLTFIAEYRGPT